MPHPNLPKSPMRGALRNVRFRKVDEPATKLRYCQIWKFQDNLQDSHRAFHKQKLHEFPKVTQLLR